MRYLIILLLTGCVTIVDKDECGYSWILENESIAEVNWIYTRTDDIYLPCGQNKYAEACSIRREGKCEIYLPKYTIGTSFCKSDEYYKHHEELHCKGYVHP